MRDKFAIINTRYMYLYVNESLCLFATVDEDIDGIPMDDDDSTSARNKEDEKKSSMPAGFVPSRWETVDPDQVCENSFVK